MEMRLDSILPRAVSCQNWILPRNLHGFVRFFVKSMFCFEAYLRQDAMREQPGTQREINNSILSAFLQGVCILGERVKG